MVGGRRRQHPFLPPGCKTMFDGFGLGTIFKATQRRGTSTGRLLPSFLPSRSSKPVEWDVHHSFYYLPGTAAALDPPFFRQRSQSRRLGFEGQGRSGSKWDSVIFLQGVLKRGRTGGGFSDGGVPCRQMSDGESQQSLSRPPPEDSRSRAYRGFPTDLTIQFDVPNYSQSIG